MSTGQIINGIWRHPGVITKKCWQINVSNNVFRRKVPNIIDHGLTSVGTNPQLHSPASHGFTSAGTRPQFVISAIQTRAHKYGGFTPADDANPLFSISKEWHQSQPWLILSAQVADVWVALLSGDKMWALLPHNWCYVHLVCQLPMQCLITHHW